MIVDLTSVLKEEIFEITKEEMKTTIKNLKKDKAMGPDPIPSELLRLIKEYNISVLVNLFNNIRVKLEYYQRRRCNDYRTISLMSHTLKKFLKVVHVRIYREYTKFISSNIILPKC